MSIDNTINTVDSQSKYEFKQSGLTVSVGGGLVNAATGVLGSVTRSGEVQDDRLKALYAYKAVDDAKKLGDYKGDLGKGIGISVSLGSSQMTSEQTSHIETVNSSNINAGGNVTIKATVGDVNFIATNINAKDITVDAKKNINIDSGENKQQATSNTSSSSWSLGGIIGTGFSGSYSKGSSSENEKITTHTGSEINASGTLKLKSGNDTNIKGSQVQGDTVVANIGGNLNIASVQDTDNYTAKNQSIGAGVSTGQVDGKPLPSGTMGPINKVANGGVNGSFNQGKTNSNYASVTNQAGIFAGDGGFNIKVGGNTDLKGAVIASESSPDKNKISTGTLTYSDIQNKAEYSASSSGFSLDTKGKIPVTPTPGMPVSGDADSTTKSAVATGTIAVRSNPNQDLSTLSRDTTGALNALDKIFDKKTVQEKQELANLFGEVAFNAIGDLALSQYKKAVEANDKEAMAKWSEGGEYKVLLHAVAGGIMSDLGGNGFASGVVSAGVNEAVQKELAKITNPGLHQLASALVGGVAAKIVGGNASVGASVAASATKNNFLSHEQYAEYQQEKKDLKDKLDNGSVKKEEYDKAIQNVEADWSEKDKKQEQEWYSEHQTTIDNINKDPGTILNETVGVNLDGTGANLSPAIIVTGTNPRIIETFIYDPKATATENAHKLLSIGGFTPLAPISEGANSIIYFAEGDNESAAIPGMKVLVVAKGAIKLVPETEAAVKFVQSYTKEVKAGESTVDIVKGSSKVVFNMGEFFQNGFGNSIKNNLSKSTLQYDGQSIYKVTSKTSNEYLKKGYGVYLDALHKDHLEVINKSGKVIYVLNLDGTLNADKTAKAIGRVIKGW